MMRPLAPAAPFLAALAGLSLAGMIFPTLGHTQDAAETAGLAAASPAPKALVTFKDTSAKPSAGGPPGKPVQRRLPAFFDQGPAKLNVDMAASGADSRVLNLAYGKSALVDLPADAKDVLVTNPAIADAVMRSRRRISIVGMAPGQTDAVFFDDAGKRILSLDIRVSKDSSGLADALQRLMPGSKMRVESVNDSLVLAGEVGNSVDAENAVKLAQRFVEKPEQVVNMLTVTGKEQVMLKVRIVEMQRSIIKQMGFNMNAVTGQLGMPQYSFGNSPSFGVNGGFMGTGGGGYSVNTTSQPVAGLPTLGGVSSSIASLAQLAGVSQTNIPSTISSFLTGAGALSTAQTVFSQSFLRSVVPGISTPVTTTDPTTGIASTHTVTAASAGINTSNIASVEQAYVNGGTLTPDQRAWMTTFNNQLPAITKNFSLSDAQTSTLVDRSNPANYVQNGMAGSTGLNQAQALLQAFERTGLVRTLAEPNLTAISGESAKFLAGGEYPVPVGQDNNGRVTVTFKPYGVGLGFTPVVLSEGRISLRISAEVSELSSDGAFSLTSSSTGANGATTAGPTLSIPGLKVRRTETTVELPSGGAMMISGLLQQQTKENIDSLPGMANLPVLGALFRSRDYLSGETELVVIVTPYLVKPTSPDKLQTPTDGLQIADDLQTDLLGKLNKSSKTPPAAVAGKTLQGPYGYVIE